MSRSCHHLSLTYKNFPLPLNFVPVIRPKYTKELPSPLFLKIKPDDEEGNFTLEKNENEDFF